MFSVIVLFSLVEAQANRVYEIKYEPVRRVCTLFFNYKSASIYKANESDLPNISCTFSSLRTENQCRLLKLVNAKSHKIKPYFQLQVKDILKLAHLDILCKDGR